VRRNVGGPELQMKSFFPFFGEILLMNHVFSIYFINMVVKHLRKAMVSCTMERIHFSIFYFWG
jgi:hypothetical protein